VSSPPYWDSHSGLKKPFPPRNSHSELYLVAGCFRALPSLEAL